MLGVLSPGSDIEQVGRRPQRRRGWSGWLAGWVTYSCGCIINKAVATHADNLTKPRYSEDIPAHYVKVTMHNQDQRDDPDGLGELLPCDCKVSGCIKFASEAKGSH